MANKSLDPKIKRQGRANVIYRDTDGKTYSAIIRTRTSATVADIVIRSPHRRVVSAAPKATTMKSVGWTFR